MIFAFLLLSISSARGFPAGRCYMRNCTSTPYDMGIVEKMAGGVCFQFNEKMCIDDDKYKCCAKFNSNLVKLVVNSRGVCSGSLDRVTVNGVRKGGGVFFDVYRDGGGELRITSLNMEKKEVMGAKICIWLKQGSACPEWETFSKDNLYALFDPLGHNCCPTCGIGDLSSGGGGKGMPPPPLIPPPPVVVNGIKFNNKVCNCSCLP